LANPLLAICGQLDSGNLPFLFRKLSEFFNWKKSEKIKGLNWKNKKNSHSTFWPQYLFHGRGCFCLRFFFCWERGKDKMKEKENSEVGGRNKYGRLDGRLEERIGWVFSIWFVVRE
jgi:hypothetical protein